MQTYQVVEAQNPQLKDAFWGGLHQFPVPPRIGEHLIFNDPDGVDRHLYEVIHVIYRPEDDDNLPVLIVQTIAWPQVIRDVEFI